MVILGGMGNVWGVALGGALLAYINYQGLYAAGNQFNSTFGTNIQIPEYAYLIYGLLIVSFMLLRPGGPDPERAPEGGAARGGPGDAGRARGDRAGMTAVAPSRLVGDRSPDRRPAPAEGVRRPGRGRGRRLHRRPPLDLEPDRPERRRQDDVLQHADRRLRAERRRDPLRRPRRRRAAAAQDHRARHGPDVPEHPPLRDDDLARERPRRHALPAAERRAAERLPLAAPAEGGDAGARQRRASSSRTAACRPGSRASTRTTWPTATSAGSRSRGRSRPSRSCCCSTSPPPA